MMYGLFPFFGLLFVIGHGLAALAGVTGLVLLIGWALKHAPAHKVKLWALWLIAIGLVLGLLTMPAMFGGRGLRGGGCFGGDDPGKDGSFRQWMMGLKADDVSSASSAISARSVRK